MSLTSISAYSGWINQTASVFLIAVIPFYFLIYFLLNAFFMWHCISLRCTECSFDIFIDCNTFAIVVTLIALHIAQPHCLHALRYVSDLYGLLTTHYKQKFHFKEYISLSFTTGDIWPFHARLLWFQLLMLKVAKTVSDTFARRQHVGNWLILSAIPKQKA